MDVMTEEEMFASGDLMHPDEIRETLFKMAPLQWPVFLEMAEHYLGLYGFDNLQDFVTTDYAKGGIGVPLEKAKELLYFNPVYKHKADKFCPKLGIAALAKSVDAAKKHGGDRKSDQPDESKNVRLKQYGNSALERIEVLKRDHPEIAKRLEAGEFKTVAEAERAAGTRAPLRPKKMVTVYLDDAENCLREAVDEILPSFVIFDLKEEGNIDVIKNIFSGMSNKEQDTFHEWSTLYVT